VSGESRLSRADDRPAFDGGDKTVITPEFVLPLGGLIAELELDEAQADKAA
jgi:hypothetical protein